MNPQTQLLDIAVVAGEASGDLLAAVLLQGLQEQSALTDKLHLHGIGGPAMAKQNFVIEESIDKLAVRGLFEVLRHYRAIKNIQTQLLARLLKNPPHVFVGVDAPDFNLTLEQSLRSSKIPTVHMVSPSIWAWRRSRIHKIAKAVSHMLVIFPFEEAIYQAAKIPVTYIGHPLAQSIPQVPDTELARKQLGINSSTQVLTLMPGSRLSELKYHLPLFLKTAQLLRKQHPGIHFLMPMAGAQQMAYLNAYLANNPQHNLSLQILEQQSHTAITAANAVLVASGTATLEVALFKKPMVIAYKMLAASWQILKRMHYQQWVGLPNILCQDAVVPEFLQNEASPEALAKALSEQLDNFGLQEQLRDRFTQLHETLTRDTRKMAAEIVLNYAKNK